MTSTAELDARVGLACEHVYREEAAALDAAVAAWERHRLATGRDRDRFQGCVDVDALVRARFVIAEGLDHDLRQGLFAAAGEHPAIVRFSTLRRGSGADAAVVDRGAAIKILADRRGRAVTLQDWLLDSTRETAVRAIADATPDALPTSALAGDADHPAGLTYYGALPSRFGRHRACKFALRPRATAPAAPLVGALAGAGPLVYDFVVQLQVDPARQPIEDASVPWDTPWITVAELHVDRGAVADAGLDPRHLVFHPYHALPEHDPLGRLNRLRRRLYGAPLVDSPGASERHPFAPPRSRVCVVGAGAAGMAAADALARRGHAVVLVDARAEVGGHAESIRCADLETDPSFGSFTAATHPNLVALLARLGVESFELAVFNEAGSWRTADGAHEWGSTEELPFHREILAEVLRFNRVDLPRVLRDPAFDDVSAADFLAANGYSRAFIVYYFFGHAVYGFPGHPYAHYLDLPIRALLTYLFDSTVHGAQALFSVAGGSGRYARAFGEALRASGQVELRLGARASVIERGEDGVLVDIAGRAERFDHLVLAVQPQHALGVLGDAATAAERDVLGGFRYTRDTVYLHTDASQMPRRRDLWRYLNIVVPPPAELDAATHFVATKVMPANRDAATPVFMTFAHHEGFVPPAGATAITRDHPRIDLTTPRQRRRLDALAGDRSTWYCGAYTRGLALHDDALVSGYAVANRILGAAESVEIIQRPALLELEERSSALRPASAPLDPAALDPAALAAALLAALDGADARARSGPLERLAREAARRLAAGPAAAAPRDEASLAEAIARIVESIAGVAVPVDAPLSAAVALDSLGLVELAEALRVALHLDLPPSLLVRDVSIAALARHAAAEARRSAPALAPGLERLAAPADAPPLFLLPPLFLDVEVFAELARELGHDRPVYGLRAPLDADDALALVLAHVRTIVDAVPTRCCFLGGYSLGGGLAHRIAERLVLEHGFTCPLVFMFDAHHPAALGDAELAAAAIDRPTLVRLFLHAVGAPRDGWEHASDEARRALALAAYRRLRDRRADEAAFDAFLRARHDLLRSLEGALLRVDELPLELPELVYFRAATRDPSGRHAERWSGHYLFATTHDLPGDHATLLRAREVIAPLMREAMATAASVAIDLARDAEPATASLFDLAATAGTGERRDLDEHRGKVVLIVNVASRCVFTPHYEGLEALHRAYGGRGFAVLGFPSDEFGGQEPGDDQAIATFCTTHYGVTFPVYAKVETRGPRACPVFRFLGARAGAPAWNFTKYLVDRAGQVVEVFPSAVRPDDPDLRAAIEAALAG